MRSRLLAAVLSALVLIIPACGGDDEQEAPEVAESETPALESVGTLDSKSGTFTVSIPEGWTGGEPNETSEIFMQNEAIPDIQLGVASAPVLGDEAEVTEYIEGQREQVEAFTNVTEVTEAAPLEYEIAGNSATFFDWFFNAETEAGPTDLIERRVIFASEGTLYDIKLQAPVAQQEEATTALDQILQSWEFNS